MIGNLCAHGPKSKEINTRIPNDPSPSLHSKNQEFSLPKQPKRCIFCHPPSDWYQKPHLHNHHQLNHSRVVIEDLIRHFSLLPQNDETNQTNETKQLYITLKVNSGYHPSSSSMEQRQRRRPHLLVHPPKTGQTLRSNRFCIPFQSG